MGPAASIFHRQKPEILKPQVTIVVEEHKFMYDLVVIGAGSGGVRAARMSAGYGARVALIEPALLHGPPHFSAIGGTCVNVGCVPKKLLLYGSHMAADFKYARGFGWQTPDRISHDWGTLMAHKDAEIARLNGVYTKMLQESGVDLIEGWGSLMDVNTVAIKETKESAIAERTITAESILLAVGSWPYVPDIPGKEHCITSNEAFYLAACPHTIIIVGGGYIAVEFAGIFHGYGAHVILAYRGDLFLRGFDDDIRHHLYGEMKATGVDIRFNTTITKVEKQSNGTFVATTLSGDTITTSLVMYATGRAPNTKHLGLENTAVELNPNTGAVVVDWYSNTTCPSIYAVGDVTDRINLTPIALHEGHCVADTLFGGKKRKPCHELVPSAVFSQPPIATVGLTAEEAGRRYGKVAVFQSTFRPLLHTMTGLPSRTLVKVIVDADTDKVLGAHMCGMDAAEIIQGIAIAVKMGAKKADFDSTVGVHPTSAEEFVTLRNPSYFIVNGEKREELS